uniref:Uncharacterized protein n=1 Tax=Nymphaea colorata TaxID=210225 RepID=A0A5K1GR38_9MAGN
MKTIQFTCPLGSADSGCGSSEISSSTNSWIFRSEEPPSAAAVLSTLFHRCAFFRISPAISPVISSLLHLSNSSLETRPFGPTWSRTPTRKTSTKNLAFVGWSVHWGNAMTGTPADNVSRVEFHPQCVKKAASA